MFLDRKPFIFLWRPLYRLVFEMVLYPCALRLWTYLLSQPLPSSLPANSMGARLQEIQHMRETLDRIDVALAESKREGLATERLILALMQEPRRLPGSALEDDSGIDGAD